MCDRETQIRPARNGTGALEAGTERIGWVVDRGRTLREELELPARGNERGRGAERSREMNGDVGNERGRVQFSGRRTGTRTVFGPGETNGDAYSFRAEPGNERGDERGRVQFSGPSRAQQERKESITNYSTSVTARAVFSMTRSGDTMATCWGSFLGHEIQLLRELRRCQAR
jgi:hypothetical protein